MPVLDHPTHEKVREGEGAVYGCWNRQRPIKGAPVVSVYSMPREWPYVFSEECRFDMSLKDPKCNGCEWRGSGEKYDEMVRRNGK